MEARRVVLSIEQINFLAVTFRSAFRLHVTSAMYVVKHSLCRMRLSVKHAGATFVRYYNRVRCKSTPIGYW